jgi:hypothetical protein
MFRVFSNTQMTLQISKVYSQPDAEDWQKIQEFQRFPLLPSTQIAFQQLMPKNHVSFDALTTIVEQDPAICLHMLLRIKQRNPASLEQINTATGCISLLGIEEVVKLIKHLPILDSVPKNRSTRNYMALLNTAVLAGHIAARWAKTKPSLNQQQARWSAMLASAPLWPWQLQQVSASQEFLNQMSRGKDLIPALETAFGTLTSTHIGQWVKLTQALALPSLCQSLWQQTCWPKPKEWQVLRVQTLSRIENQRNLKHQCQQPEMLIYMANALATQYQLGAYRIKTRRWLYLSAHFLNEEVQQVHRDMVIMNLQWAKQGHHSSSIPTLLAPTNTSAPQSWVYFCEKRTSQFEVKNNAQKIASNIDAKERNIDHRFLNRLMKQLNEAPEKFGDWHYLMRSVLQGVTQGIGLKHAYIMVKNKSTSAAKVYYQQGLAETDPLCHFVISLNEVSVFKHMLEKPASLMVSDRNRGKMLRGVPLAQQNVLPQEFMMMSLSSNGRPIGIIFADMGKDPHAPKMKTAEYTAFKSLCLAASKGLSKLASVAQKKVTLDNAKATRRQT